VIPLAASDTGVRPHDRVGRVVDGRIDPAFQAVREVFEASFTDGQNAVAVFVNGRAVVDLWGGVADPDGATLGA
jgi:hypothetical protein